MREVKYSPTISLWGWSGWKEEHILTTRNVAACVKLRAQGTLPAKYYMYVCIYM